MLWPPRGTGPRKRLWWRLWQRGPDDLVDVGGAGRQHDQAVKAEGRAARRRHQRQGGEKVLVDRVALAVDPRLLVHLQDESPPLLAGVGQFAEAVGQFD